MIGERDSGGRGSPRPPGRSWPPRTTSNASGWRTHLLDSIVASLALYQRVGPAGVPPGVRRGEHRCNRQNLPLLDNFGPELPSDDSRIFAAYGDTGRNARIVEISHSSLKSRPLRTGPGYRSVVPVLAGHRRPQRRGLPSPPKPSPDSGPPPHPPRRGASPCGVRHIG